MESPYDMEIRFLGSGGDVSGTMDAAVARVDRYSGSLGSELHALTCMIAEMGGFAEKQVVEAIDSLSTRDVKRAQRMIADDAILDLKQREIEARAVAAIAQWHPPMAELRGIVSTIRIANDLERIGDLAKNIGKRVVMLNGEMLPRRAIRGVVHMANLSLRQIKDSLDSYMGRDSHQAAATWHRDDEVDSMYVSLFRELIEYMREDPGMAVHGLHLLFCSKNLESIGDHATSIAEATFYMAEGRHADVRFGSDGYPASLLPVATRS